MSFVVTLSSKNIPATARQLGKTRDYFSNREFSKAPAKAAATAAMEAIKSRTARQLDLDKRPFEPLSPEYSKRKFRKVGNADPDLRFTGAMIGSMRTWVSRPGRDVNIRVGFADQKQARKATALERGDIEGLPQRRFMGLTRGETFHVRNVMRKEILAEIRR